MKEYKTLHCGQEWASEILNRHAKDGFVLKFVNNNFYIMERDQEQNDNDLELPAERDGQ